MDGAQAQQHAIRLIMGQPPFKGPAPRRGLFSVPTRAYLEPRQEDMMPNARFAIILLSVLIAAGASVWLMSLGGPGLMVAALPAFLIAAVAIRYLNR